MLSSALAHGEPVSPIDVHLPALGASLLALCVFSASLGVGVLVPVLALTLLLHLVAWRRARTQHKDRDRVSSMSRSLSCVVDAEGRASSHNAAWRAVLGYDPRELSGMSWAEFTQPWVPRAPLRDLLSSGQDGDTLTFESHVPCKSGGRRWLAWTVRLFPSEHLAYAVAHDVDVERRSAAALAGRCDELVRSNAALEQFAMVAAHDLQEPLRMVSSYTQLLAERYRDRLDAKADHIIHYTVDGASRMHAIIHDLLSLARVNIRGVEKGPIPVESVLREALQNLQSSVHESGATVTASPLPVVHANRTYFVQLLQNLLANAIKFRADRPLELHVWATRSDDRWTIAVRDNGIGIPAGQGERVFGAFERVHGRSTYPGAGMGLALCRKIVELHGGKIRVESELGLGSTFYFTLPHARDE